MKEEGGRDRTLVFFSTFENTKCRDPETGLESMDFRFDHRVVQQICAGSTNPGPETPEDGASTPEFWVYWMLTTPQ